PSSPLSFTIPPPPTSPPFPYTTLFRSLDSSLDANEVRAVSDRLRGGTLKLLYVAPERFNNERFLAQLGQTKIALFAVDEAHCISDRKSTRLNSSHVAISYAVFCLKKKK